MNWIDIATAIDRAPAYRVVLFFFGFYPLFMSVVWMILSIIYFLRRERGSQAVAMAPDDYKPFVSLIIPAYAEEKTIGRTLDAMLRLDYPAYEVIVANDGSPDGTTDAVRPYLASGKVRLLDKKVNEGKAMALNDALPLCRGEIVVIVDADIVLDSQVLNAMVPHFFAPRVAAVTGNPRVANRKTLLQGLQTLEFTSIVSVQRRAQRVWGRILTVSGAIAAIRKSALLDVGMFSPDMATEDIDVTWKVQRNFWDVRYEPTAIAWMEVPPTLGELWKQRRRWARGLAQVLVKHRGILTRWVYRRFWPIYIEAVLSIFWAYCFVFITTFWVVSNLGGYAPYGSSPIPNLWGMLIASAAVLQLLTGVLIDQRYDDGLARYFPLAVVYPAIYWMLMAIITSVYTVETLLRKRPTVQTWKIERAG